VVDILSQIDIVANQTIADGLEAMWQFLARRGEARRGEASIGLKISPNSPKD
jgi:hypothetical protein